MALGQVFGVKSINVSAAKCSLLQLSTPFEASCIQKYLMHGRLYRILDLGQDQAENQGNQWSRTNLAVSLAGGSFRVSGVPRNPLHLNFLLIVHKTFLNQWMVNL